MPFNVICGYRRPPASCKEAQAALTEVMSKTHRRHWVFCTEWHMPPEESPLATVMEMAGGVYVGGSGHRRSSQTIDTVWASGSLAQKTDDLPQISDHTGSLVQVSQVYTGDDLPSWCFRPHAPLVPGEQTEPNEADSFELWGRMACPDSAWQAMVQNRAVENLWNTWSSNAETFLRNLGIIFSVKACPKDRYVDN